MSERHDNVAQSTDAPNAFVEHLHNCPACANGTCCPVATLLWNDIVEAAHREPQVLIFDREVLARMRRNARDDLAFPE